jgi:hypothetical protein
MPSNISWSVQEDVVMLCNLCQGKTQQECTELLESKLNSSRGIPAVQGRTSLLKKSHPQIWRSDQKAWEKIEVYRLIYAWLTEGRITLMEVQNLSTIDEQ